MKSVINRYDFSHICAGIMKLVNHPELFERYKKFLSSPDMFFKNDTSTPSKCLRSLIKLLIEVDKDTISGSNVFSIDYIRSQIPVKIQDTDKSDEMTGWFDMVSKDPKIISMMGDKGSFENFENYLKLLQVAYVSGDFYEQYQKGNILHAMEIMQGALDNIASMSISGLDTLSDNDIESFLNPDMDEHQRVLPIGCKALDEFMGCLEPQTLTIYMAPPNTGKSTMCHHLISQSIKEKLRAVVFCVEDNKKSFMHKSLSCLTGIPKWRIKRASKEGILFLDHDERALIKKARGDLSKYIKVFYVYNKSIEAIHRMAVDYDTECRHKGIEIPIVNIVDYTMHISSQSGGGDKMYEKHRNSYAARKNYALEYNKICVDFAQVNREGGKAVSDDKILDHTDLAGAYDISQVADNIVSINRTPSDYDTMSCKLYVSKSRDGLVGIAVSVNTEFHKARFNMDAWKWFHAPENIIKQMPSAESGRVSYNETS